MNTQYIKYMLLPAALFSTVAFAQEEETKSEQIHVAFRTIAADDVLGGVSSINYEELAAKNNNTYSLDNMQGYVSGFNGASMWGQSDYLVLVDGVPREANNVKPEEIAEVTFMKGSSAVILYGSRAAKGALLITTKRGKQGDIEIKVNANTGWNFAKSLPQYLGSAEYMTLYNQAGGSYSKEDIYHAYAQDKPYMIPNNDFYSSDYIKKQYNRWEVSTEFRGGGERARYYSNVGYYREGGYINFGKAKGNYNDRLNVRGNVDMVLTDWISAYVDATASFYSQRTARGANFWEGASTLRPNRLVLFFPTELVSKDGFGNQELINSAQLINGMMIGGTKNDKTNFVVDNYLSGINRWNSRNFQFAAGINFDLDRVLKGLSFKTMAAVDYATEYSVYLEDKYATYEPTWASFNGKEEIVSIEKIGSDKHTGSQSIGGSKFNQTIQFNAHFDYDRSFGLHNVSAMALVNGYQQKKSGVFHATSNANLGLLASYNYAHKYYAEFGGAWIYSAKLPEGNRVAMNYSATLGWNIAKEAFMEGTIWNDLMLSANYSKLNQDLDVVYNNNEYYLYTANYDNAQGEWYGWGGADSQHATEARSGSNPGLGFVANKQISVSLRGALLDRSLKFGASFFETKIEGLLTKVTTSFPNYFEAGWPQTSFIPIINFNNDKRYGVEANINYDKKIGEVELGVGANMTWYATKATKRDNTAYADAYQYREGKALDAVWGYECLGFITEEDLNNPDFPDHTSTGNQTPAVNDLKYKDKNGDGVIDNKDQVDLGRAGWYGNPLTLGVNLTAKYKGFTLFVLGVGGFGGHAQRSGSYYQIDGDSKYSVFARDYRTAENPNGKYPRLTTGSGANNFVTSDFWMYKTDRFNIAKVQLTYDCPTAWFENQKIVKGVSMFVNGANLLTISPEKDILELNVGSAPQSRFYQAGLSVTF